MEIIKEFAYKSTTSSLKERNSLFERVFKVLENRLEQNVPEAAYKVLAKLNYYLFPIYIDKQSKENLIKLNNLLIEIDCQSCAKIILTSLELHSKNLISHPNRSSSMLSLYGQDILNGFIKSALVNNKIDILNTEGEKISKIYSNFTLVAYSHNSGKLFFPSYKKLKYILDKIPSLFQKFVSSLQNDREKPVNNLLFFGYLLKYLSDTKNNSGFEELKKSVTKIYVESLIGSRVKLDTWLVECGNFLLKFVTEEDFKVQLMPELKRSLLRNPEIIMQSLALIFQDLKFDLGDYLAEFLPLLNAQIISKEESLQTESIKVVQALSNHCKNVDSLQTIIKSLFAQLNSAQGKLFTQNQKQSVLTAIGYCSSDTLSQDILPFLLTQFKDYLKVETNEQTIIHAFQNFKNLLKSFKMKNFSPEAMLNLKEFFKIQLNTSNNNIRSSIFQTMASIFWIQQLRPCAVDFKTQCTKSLEKVQSVVMSNSSLSNEAISASLILALDSNSITSTESDILALIDSKRAIFTNEKFVSSLNENGLAVFVLLVERLIEINTMKEIKFDINSWIIPYLFILMNPKYSIRCEAQNSLKRVLSWAPYSLIESLFELTEKTINLFQPDTANAKNWPSKKSLCELLLIISSVENLNKCQVEELSVKFILISSIDFCFTTDKFLYEKCLIQLLKKNPIDQTDFRQLIRSQTEKLIHVTIDSETLDEKQLNSVETLCRLDYKNYLKSAVDMAIDSLSSNLSKLGSIGSLEYQIMRTKAGELFDKSLIENFLKQQREASSQTNIRRENKTYSYKEQLADLELKKELESKKGAKTEEVVSLEKIRAQMSKKQQDLLDAQIERETSIRKEMTKLDNLVRKSCSILIHSIRGNIEEFSFHILKLTRLFSLLVRSPLCLNHIISVFRELELNNQIVFAFIRLSNPAVELDPWWTQEPLDHMVKRILKSMNEEKGFNPTKPALYHPFLKCAYQHRSLEERDYEMILEIIEKFCLTRHSQLDHHLKSHIPDFRFIIDNFPSREFVNVLLNIMIVSSERNLSFNLSTKCGETLRNIIAFTNKLLTNPDIDLMESKSEFVQIYNFELSELIEGLFCELYSVRETCLNCLSILINNRNLFLIEKPNFMINDAVYSHLRHRLAVSCHDDSESNRMVASKIWKEGSFESDEQLCHELINDLVYPAENVRYGAATALAHLVSEKHGSLVPSVVQSLIELYKQHIVLKEPEKDQFGRIDPHQIAIDDFDKRTGIAHGFTKLSKSVPTNNQTLVIKVFQFLIYEGMNDRNVVVRNKMLAASIEWVNDHGKSNIASLLPLFEKFLEEAPKDACHDAVRQSVIISMGTLAKHLDKDDSKVAPIIGKLVKALQTPSQQVQEAVANCLPPLIASIKSQVPNYIDQLLNELLNGKTYGERRGAAYGLAGMLKGSGMLSLKQLNVLQRLNEAINNKQEAKHREGALIGYEMLCSLFGKFFEPYSVEVLPNLLLCFGDADESVRQAADDCAKAIMKNLTATGVKMILPKLLERLGDDESWRTKCGSVELLGSMAHCAPKQLSTCLPNIVPKLIEILSDSHVKVQMAGAQALRHIGSVIKNPEILSITNILLEALQDPAVKTSKALQVLLETKFVHFIDAPSLALIIPVVKRAFQDRSTEIRKMAAQIMGNMYSLTDQKDLVPYLSSILPGLKLSLLDPVPEVRAVSAKALGAMIKVIGENGLAEIIAWLMEKLVSEVSSVDRSGAAQGLSEVFGALGVEKLEKSMPEIIERAIQTDLSPFIRDGYLMMFIYLPLTFGDAFIPYIGLIIQPILKALADDSEFLRDTSIKAGQRIVNMYADCAISLFLPELEKGLFDLNWRIRFSSVQLLGDLLYKISGVVGKMTTESAHEDDNFGTEKGSIAIINSLGKERRNRIYSGLYMGRSDTSLQVRQAALHIWKVIVSNTPKTLKEILSTLFHILLSCLSSPNNDKRQIAATTLVDIVKKLGERILPDILPILEKGLNTESSAQRQGVCIALSEIMANISRDNVLIFSDNLIPTVRQALMDRSAQVRSNAAKTFDSLHSMIGVKALEEVCLSLYDEMKSSDKERSERALDALKQIMLVKSRAILPFLIPHLTTPPININALCKLCCATNTEVLGKHLSKVLVSLLQALSALSSNATLNTEQSTDSESPKWIHECEQLLLSIEDPDGVKTLVNELIHNATHTEKSVLIKSAALDMLGWFCSKTSADYSDYYDELLKSLLGLFAEADKIILEKAWLCVNHIIQRLSGTGLTLRLPIVRQSLRSFTKLHSQNLNLIYNLSHQSLEFMHLPGFCLAKKGISCILPIFKEGLLNGSPDIKEQSAQILCECIKLSDGESLKSSVMAITGPLIRILGERYNWSVKSAILDAIYLLLLKVRLTLKPFLPQLQPTFIKNLSDNNRNVRLKSGYALAKLLEMNPKMDAIINDILTMCKNALDLQIKETYLNTIRLCMISVGSKLNIETNKQVFSVLKEKEYFYSAEQSIRSVSSGILGSLLGLMDVKDFELIFLDLIDYEKYAAKQSVFLQSHCMLAASALQVSASKCLRFEQKLLAFLRLCSQSENAAVCMSSIRACCFLLSHNIGNELKSDINLVTTLARCINQNSNDIKLLLVQVVIYLSTVNEKVFDNELIRTFVPMLVNGTREKASNIRLASEIALIKMLKLKTDQSLYNETLKSLGTMKDSFEDCVRSIGKESYNAQLTINIDEFNIDETYIKLD
ncbi:translational activator GCN1 [Brachionus plicatilis]|uniref:Translational activator GCN1 n=1 Tax=Brachionus plicatilis TaxID=10195 RepID=A0A3M7PM26_BRAPC|nr:translational activator GCN1 [Brachionus plicatilis]